VFSRSATSTEPCRVERMLTVTRSVPRICNAMNHMVFDHTCKPFGGVFPFAATYSLLFAALTHLQTLTFLADYLHAKFRGNSSQLCRIINYPIFTFSLQLTTQWVPVNRSVGIKRS